MIDIVRSDDEVDHAPDEMNEHSELTVVLAVRTRDAEQRDESLKAASR